MNNRLYVGGLPYGTDDNELKQLFEEATGAPTVEEGVGTGSVQEVNIMRDRETNRSRGFGFVTMTASEHAEKAIKLFNGVSFGGRTLIVAEAEERGARNSSGFGGGNRRSGSSDQRRGGGGGYNSGNRSSGRGYHSNKE